MKITQHYPLLLATFFPFFCSTLCLHPLLVSRRVVFTIPKVLGIARVVHSTNSPVSAVSCCSCQSRELDYCLEIAIGSNMWGRNISGKGRLEAHFPVLDSPWRSFINAMELDALSCSFLWALSLEVPAAWLSLPRRLYGEDRHASLSFPSHRNGLRTKFQGRKAGGQQVSLV